MVAHCSNPSTWEVQAAWSGTPGQPGTCTRPCLRTLKGKALKAFCVWSAACWYDWILEMIGYWGSFSLVPALSLEKGFYRTCCYRVSSQCWDYMYVSMPNAPPPCIFFLMWCWDSSSDPNVHWAVTLNSNCPQCPISLSLSSLFQGALLCCCGSNEVNGSKV